MESIVIRHPHSPSDSGEARQICNDATSETNGSLCGKRVLIVVENLPVPFDRRVWQEANALREAGMTVSVICPKSGAFNKSYETIDGIHIYRHPLFTDATSVLGYLCEYSCALFWQTLLAWKIFFTRGFDVLQVCNPPDLGFLIALQFKILGRKYIFDHHDINPELFEAKFGRRGFLWKLIALIERINFRIADVVISTNQSYRAIAIERGKIDPGDVFVVRSGPDMARIQCPAPDDTWKRGRSHLVGYVGVMGQQEGIDLLLQSARHIIFDKGRTDITFCLVGSGASLAGAMRLCADMGLADHVHFTGRLPDADLFSVLATADVCVSTDRVNPMNDLSTMNKVLEYMAFGKAQVQFDVKEGRYSAGESSLYARPNDPEDFARCLLELLDNAAHRERMGQLGRQRFEDQLSWGRQKTALRAAYRRALER
jgi:glycosyltransferase involved in cell wall biosynthesis